MTLTDPLVDATVVENLIAQLLVTGPDKVEPGISVYASHESTPSPEPDAPGDQAIKRWCRLNGIKIDDAPGRTQSGDGDQQNFVMSITVGVSADEARKYPARLSQSVGLIKAALKGAYATHADTTHHVQIKRASSSVETNGQHNASEIGVIVISGMLQRVSGRTMSLEI